MKNSRANNGFSILEAMITIGIFSVAVYLFAQFIQTNIITARFTDEQGQAVALAQRGIETAIQEIREASFSESGDFPVFQANDQEIIFYSDIDADEATERVRYTLSGTNLIKGTIEPTDGITPEYNSADEIVTTIAQYVRNGSDPLFYYYDTFAASGISTPLATPLDPLTVKLVQMNITVNVDPRRAPQDITLESFVAIRNLKPQW